MREVAVEVNARRWIFTNKAVAVDVASLGENVVRRNLALLAVRCANDAWINRIDDVCCGDASGGDASHGKHQSVAIDICRSILVDGAVTIVIDGARVGCTRCGHAKRSVARIWVRKRNHMHAHSIQESRICRDDVARSFERLLW